MAKPKLYTSEAWLKSKYLKEGKSIDDIAAICGVSHNTIRTALLNAKLIRGK